MMNVNDHDEIIGTGIPHSQFGDKECCGCLNGVIRGDHGDIVCNECRKVIRIVQAADLQRTLNETELELDFATAKCAYCGTLNVLDSHK